MSKIGTLSFPKADLRVRVVKQCACANPATQPASWNEWIPGRWDNQGSLPVDYEVEGILFEPIEVGRNLCVLRQVRNGVKLDGSFISTTIMTIEVPDRVVTRNSVYIVSTL